MFNFPEDEDLALRNSKLRAKQICRITGSLSVCVVCVCGGGRGEERQEVRINTEPGMLGNGIFKGVLATFLRWKLSVGFSQLKLPLAEWPCHRDNS